MRLTITMAITIIVVAAIAIRGVYTGRDVSLFCWVESDEGHATTAKNPKKLIEQGFEYVTEIEGEQLFRKVKKI